MTRSQRLFTAQQKLAAVRRHLVDKTPVSDLCEELGLQPTQIYTWQKQLFENGDAAFLKPDRNSKQYVNYWTERAETPAKQIVQWIGVTSSKFYDWRKRYGKVNEHNAAVPRDFDRYSVFVYPEWRLL